MNIRQALLLIMVSAMMPLPIMAQLIGEYRYALPSMNLVRFPANSMSNRDLLSWGRISGDGLFDVLGMRTDSAGAVTRAIAYRLPGNEMPVAAARDEQGGYSLLLQHFHVLDRSIQLRVDETGDVLGAWRIDVEGLDYWPGNLHHAEGRYHMVGHAVVDTTVLSFAASWDHGGGDPQGFLLSGAARFMAMDMVVVGDRTYLAGRTTGGGISRSTVVRIEGDSILGRAFDVQGSWNDVRLLRIGDDLLLVASSSSGESLVSRMDQDLANLYAMRVAGKMNGGLVLSEEHWMGMIQTPGGNSRLVFFDGANALWARDVDGSWKGELLDLDDGIAAYSTGVFSPGAFLVHRFALQPYTCANVPASLPIVTGFDAAIIDLAIDHAPLTPELVAVQFEAEEVSLSAEQLCATWVNSSGSISADDLRLRCTQDPGSRRVLITHGASLHGAGAMVHDMAGRRVAEGTIREVTPGVWSTPALDHAQGMHVLRVMKDDRQLGYCMFFADR
jgi:hypothetical protein